MPGKEYADKNHRTFECSLPPLPWDGTGSGALFNTFFFPSESCLCRIFSEKLDAITHIDRLEKHFETFLIFLIVEKKYDSSRLWITTASVFVEAKRLRYEVEFRLSFATCRIGRLMFQTVPDLMHGNLFYLFNLE